MTCRLRRVVKYRGSAHGTDEYPFLIGDDGIWVQPITSLGLDYTASNELIPTGVPHLDDMLDHGGYYRGSSVLISGTAGTGKTSLAASLVDAACRRGERCLYIAFEESTSQVLRNMRSIGIDLAPWVEQGLLRFRAARPSFYGVEMHLMTLQKLVEEVQPSVVVVDPLTNLIAIASDSEVKSMLTRLIDFLKMQQVTALFTSLTGGGDAELNSEVGISSLMDTWLLVRNLEAGGERNRAIYVLKSRGQAHSTQVREFRLTNHGIQLVDVYVGPEGILTGSVRLAQEGRERSMREQRQAEIERRQREMARKRRAVEAQMAVLQAEIEAEEEQLQQALAQEAADQKSTAAARDSVARLRQGVGDPTPSKNGPQSTQEEA